MCDSDTASPPSLPIELVTRLLQHVSQQEKQGAARVCSSWKAASLAATSALELTHCSSDKFDTFLPWLSKHQQSLSHLTSLHLQLHGRSTFEIPQLPCRHLRELKLSATVAYGFGTLLSAPTLQACAGTLTKLTVTGFALSSLDATSLGQMTALQELDFHNCEGLDAEALLALPSLKYLNLHYARLSPVTARKQLPAFLSKQQDLTRLEFAVLVTRHAKYGLDSEWECQLAAQLTASSSTLQHLDLSGLLLSHQTWPHMFPEGRPLPQLRYFRLPDLQEPGAYLLGYRLGANDVNALARCCPGLQALECQRGHVLLQPALSSLSSLTSLQAVVPSIGPDAAVQVVTTLTGLQRLDLIGLHLHAYYYPAVLLPLLRCSRLTSLACASATMEVAHDAFAPTLAQLTALVELDLSRAPLRETQLLFLTSLVRLTRLRFSRHGLSPAFAQQTVQAIGWREGWERTVHEVKATHDDGAPPDVWKPLHRCFAAHYTQLQDDLSASKMQVGLQQQETRRLQQQVQQLQQERQQHVQQLATQQQQMQQHAQTMSDRDVVVAVLQLEVARLRCQLQQATGGVAGAGAAAAASGAPVLGPLAAPPAAPPAGPPTAYMLPFQPQLQLQLPPPGFAGVMPLGAGLLWPQMDNAQFLQLMLDDNALQQQQQQQVAPNQQVLFGAGGVGQVNQQPPAAQQ